MTWKRLKKNSFILKRKGQKSNKTGYDLSVHCNAVFGPNAIKIFVLPYLRELDHGVIINLFYLFWEVIRITNFSVI